MWPVSKWSCGYLNALYVAPRVCLFRAGGAWTHPMGTMEVHDWANPDSCAGLYWHWLLLWEGQLGHNRESTGQVCSQNLYSATVTSLGCSHHLHLVDWRNHSYFPLKLAMPFTWPSLPPQWPTSLLSVSTVLACSSLEINNCRDPICASVGYWSVSNLPCYSYSPTIPWKKYMLNSDIPSFNPTFYD